MTTMDDFILADELLLLQEDAMESYYISNETQIRGKNEHDLYSYLNDITDGIEVSSKNISDPLIFDKIRSFLKAFPSVPSRISSRLFDIVLSAFKKEIRSTAEDINNNEKDTFQHHKMFLELYGFLIHWFLLRIEDIKPADTTPNLRKKFINTTGGGFDWHQHKVHAFEIGCLLFDLKLTKIWTLTPERNTVVSLFTKPAYQLFENPANTKSKQLKDPVFRLLGLCIKHHEHSSVAHTTIMQNLQYWEHSADTMADLLRYLVEQQGYTQLADEILQEISNKEFKEVTSKEVKDSPNPKTFSSFLLKLTETTPKTILKSLTLLISQLGSESYTMRSTLIEILGYMIQELAKTIQENPAHMDQINNFFDVLKERLLDTHAYCRQKVFQVYLRLLDLKLKFPQKRHDICELSIRHLEDKSSNVRKYTIRTLSKLILTHPFNVYGGELEINHWNKMLEKLEAEIEEVTDQDDEALALALESNGISSEDNNNQSEEQQQNQDEQPQDQSSQEQQVQNSEDNNEQQQEQQQQRKKKVISPDQYAALKKMRTYHKDAITFIKLVHGSIPVICQLLSSKSKAEVLESMDYLVNTYNYKIDLALDGIKKMLHLIWTKDTSDEGKGIKMRLLSCFQSLYLEPDYKKSRKENVSTITKNLIELTYHATLGELTSLEQVLSTLMSENNIAADVIERLWTIYGKTNNTTPKQVRKGAIIILGMLAKSKTRIVSDKLEVMLKIGLGPWGKQDLDLAKYTCIALQRLNGTNSNVKGRGIQEGIRYPLRHPMFARLKSIIEYETSSRQWFSLAQEVINTIHTLCEKPDVLFDEIIQEMTKKIFNKEIDEQTDILAPQAPIYESNFKLAQLFFLVGHIAFKLIVHLEVLESAWKRKNQKKNQETQKENDQQAEQNELEQVGGTAEDDIGEAVMYIREREILFGPKSLLALYGPLIMEVCTRNKVYTDPILQQTATLALGKFMCISSEFCEKNLPLLFTILEKSKDQTIRGNLVIALSDIAVCFSTLLDDNITFLYNRLGDSDTVVKKNAVMVLTHLILNGMIKVKGQISEMAKCLEDPDQRISDLAKLFFTELASKDNAIYNNLPDIISNLMASKVPEENFRNIMKFIFSFEFAEREKQAENIVDKLCQRFLQSQEERNWRDIAYCMSLLPFKSERTFRKLIEGWPTFQDKVHEDQVYKHFTEIIQKGRLQKTQKPELKALIDDLEEKITKQRGPIQEEKAAERAAGRSAKKQQQQQQPGRRSTRSRGGEGSSQQPKETKPKRKRGPMDDDIDPEEEDFDMDLLDDDTSSDDDEEEDGAQEEEAGKEKVSKEEAGKEEAGDDDMEESDEDEEMEEVAQKRKRARGKARKYISDNSEDEEEDDDEE